MSRVSIHIKDKKIPVTSHLYGIFLEDINRAVDGGLYPEMIRNRTFEDSLLPDDCSTPDEGYALVTSSGWRDEFNHGEGLSRWVRQNETPYTPIPAWYQDNALMELDTVNTLGKNRKAALAVVFREEGKIYNTGFCGVPQQAGHSYKLSMFAKSEETTVLTVCVKEGKTIYSQSQIKVDKNEYTFYETILIASGDTGRGVLEISCSKGGKVTFGYLSLMPLATFKGHGLRIDIAEKLLDLKPSFFRFPGGCIVEGISPSTAMRFCNTVGPVWERPGQQLMWHYRASNGLGFHEYLQFCEDLEMEPVYVFNCGMTCQARNEVLMEGTELEDMIQDTLDAIEYAVGEENTHWGALRAKMGHPAPFSLNYVEIGNENHGAAYEERYRKCYKAIKERYPHIKCIGNTHLEQKGLPVDIVDEHYYNTAEYFAEQYRMFDSYDRKGPEIFLGEVAVVRGYVGQLYGALAEAAFFTGVERNQDIITMVSYAPLLENVNYQAWFPNLIRFNNLKSFGIPSYYVWKLFGNHRGEYVLGTKEEVSVIYRPVKGMASLLGKAGLVFRGATWNGKKTEISRELSGRVTAADEVYTILGPDEEQRKENLKVHNSNAEDIFVIFGEEKDTVGTFQIEIKAESDREIILGIFSSRMPKEVYVSDETNPPKEWNTGNVKPFLWKLSGGKSSLVEKEYPADVLLDEEKDVELIKDRFNTFSYTTDGKELVLCVNGMEIHRITLPNFPALHMVATDTEEEVILKMVNMSEEEDEVLLELDCEVEEKYKAYILEGKKEEVNSFTETENICDREYLLTGASSRFLYKAPALSLNILRLVKRKAEREDRSNEAII